jgi:hypothetical protein
MTESEQEAEADESFDHAAHENALLHLEDKMDDRGSDAEELDDEEALV